jgi:hypothetical protein
MVRMPPLTPVEGAAEGAGAGAADVAGAGAGAADVAGAGAGAADVAGAGAGAADVAGAGAAVVFGGVVVAVLLQPKTIKEHTRMITNGMINSFFNLLSSYSFL